MTQETDDEFELIRDQHHTRTEKYLANCFKEINIPDTYAAFIIGRIARGHRVENLHDQELFNNKEAYQSHPINIPFLACLLRIADELDLSFERTPLVIYEHVTPRDKISEEHWQRNISVAGIIANPQNKLELIGQVPTCKSHKIHRALKQLESKINSELDELPDLVFQYGDFIKDLPRKFTFHITPKGYLPYDFKFSLKEDSIAKLLLGEKLYTEKEECIRELLKNSYDACRLKKESEFTPPTYKPKIVVELMYDGKELSVYDDGIGMDKTTIERYLTKIGESFYGYDQEETELGFTPVSELGVGILSCFMLSNQIHIETKTKKSEPLLIEIDDLSDFFITRPGARTESGTRVNLKLKISKNFDLVNIIKKYARHIDIPVVVKINDDEPITIINEGFLSKTKAFNSQIYVPHLVHIISENSVEGEIGLFGDLFMTPKQISKKARVEQRYQGDLTSISNEGIFVCNEDLFPDWVNRSAAFQDLNIKKRSLDLNTARNGILKNEKYDDLKSLIEDQFVELTKIAVKKIEKETKDNQLEQINMIRRLFSQYIVFPLSDPNYFSIFPEKLINLFKTNYYFRIIIDSKTSYMKYKDILESKKKIIFIITQMPIDTELENMLCKSSEASNENLCFLEDGIANVNEEVEGVPKMIFRNVTYEDVPTFLGLKIFTADSERPKFVPPNWPAGKLLNYQTNHLLVIVDNNMIFNLDNNFVKLLLDHPSIYENDDKMATLLGFFTFFTDIYNKDFKNIVSKQDTVLGWFKDAGIIESSDYPKYYLDKDDIPAATAYRYYIKTKRL